MTEPARIPPAEAETEQAQQRGARYPGYDVLRKRNGPSWNDATRQVIDARLATPSEPTYLEGAARETLKAVCERLMPQLGIEQGRTPVPVAALVDAKLRQDQREGYRDARLPPLREAWQRGLAALDAEAREQFGGAFAALDAARQDDLLQSMQRGALHGPGWGDMPAQMFFTKRLMHDVLAAYYSHPAAWSEIGFGGPASPRGYVRMYFDRRDPWEASQARPGHARRARRENEDVG
jgi:hypothetical protein